MTTAQFGSYISADSHVTEPPEAYAQIDAAFRDRAPRLEHLPGMGATIVIDPGGEGEAFVPFGRIAAAGRTHIDRPDGWRWDELHRGGYDAVARISEQTADGFAAEVMFPSVGMVLCNHHGLEHPVHVGSAGFASPGHRIVVLDDHYQEPSPGRGSCAVPAPWSGARYLVHSRLPRRSRLCHFCAT